MNGLNGDDYSWWQQWIIEPETDAGLQRIWEDYKKGQYVMLRGIYNEPLFLKKYRTLYGSDVSTPGFRQIESITDEENLKHLKMLIEEAGKVKYSPVSGKAIIG